MALPPEALLLQLVKQQFNQQQHRQNKKILAEPYPSAPPAAGGVAVQQWGCKLLTPPGARCAPTRGGSGQIF